MGKWRIRVSVLLAVLMAVGSVACERRSITVAPGAAVQGQTYLMDASAFNLQRVADLFYGGKVVNFEQLENYINTPDAMINNVDIDSDGMIDYVAVRGDQMIEFLAIPSSNPNADPTLIASITISRSDGQVTYVASYPSRVAGWDHFSYNQARPVGLTDVFLTSWFMSNRPVYYAPHVGGYAPRPRVVGVPQVDYVPTTRQVTTTTTTVSPIKRQTAPSNPNAVYGNKVQSSKAAPAPTSKSGLRDFKQRDTSKPFEAATGFGAPSGLSAPVKPSANNSGWNKLPSRTGAMPAMGASAPVNSNYKANSGFKSSSGNSGGWNKPASAPSQPSPKPSSSSYKSSSGFKKSSGNKKGW